MLNKRRKSQILVKVNHILDMYENNQPPMTIIPKLLSKQNILFDEVVEEGFSGALFCIKGQAVILVNKGQYLPRKHFTMAHELGHYFLKHLEGDGHIACIEQDISEENNTKEQEANCFARYFLMPFNQITEKVIEFEVKKLNGNKFRKSDESTLLPWLAEYFQVSKEAMGYRWETYATYYNLYSSS